MLPSPVPGTSFDSGLRPEQILAERPSMLATPWGPMAIFRLGERLVCAQAFCPHLLGPLFQGSVVDGKVTCPWHQWRFDLCTGKRVDWRRPPGGEAAKGLLRCAVSVGPAGTLLLAPLQD